MSNQAAGPWNTDMSKAPKRCKSKREFLLDWGGTYSVGTWCCIKCSEEGEAGWMIDGYPANVPSSDFAAWAEIHTPKG